MAQGCTLGHGYGALPGLVKMDYINTIAFKKAKRTMHSLPQRDGIMIEMSV